MFFRQACLTLLYLAALCILSNATENWDQFRGPGEDGRADGVVAPGLRVPDDLARAPVVRVMRVREQSERNDRKEAA